MRSLPESGQILSLRNRSVPPLQARELCLRMVDCDNAVESNLKKRTSAVLLAYVFVLVNFRASILLLLMLCHMAQATAFSPKTEAECCCSASVADGCCVRKVAALSEEACACEKTPASTPQPKPVLPPPAQNREMVPQVVWALLNELLVFVPIHDAEPQVKAQMGQCSLITQSHVRLSVLHSALLM
jgi:hypothetical protein